MKFFIMILMIISFSLQANECIELTKCIEHISKLTGKKYIYDSQEVKGGIHASSNTQITSENADTLFTFILDLNGYTRVPTIEKDTYLIINARDLRYKPFPLIQVDSDTPPSLVANYDYYLMSFKFKHFKHGQLRGAANSMRPFMSRYGRIIEFKGTGLLTIQENAAHLARAYEIIKSFDRELSKEEIKEQNEQREAEYKDEKKAARKGKQNQQDNDKEEVKEDIKK